MPLTRSIKLISVSNDGTIITIQDTTGAYSSPSNIGGFGAPNPDVTSFTRLLVVGSYLDGAMLNLISTDSITVQAFLNGTNLQLSSLMSTAVSGVYPFKDGVLKLSSYAMMDSLSAAGAAGNNYVTGSGLDNFLLADFVVTPDYTLYAIDKTNPANTNTQVYLKCTIGTDFSPAYPAYYAGTYAMVTVEFQCKLTDAIADMAGLNGDEQDKADFLADMLVKKFGADFKFAAKDYAGADYSIRSGITRLNKLHHG